MVGTGVDGGGLVGGDAFTLVAGNAQQKRTTHATAPRINARVFRRNSSRLRPTRSVNSDRDRLLRVERRDCSPAFRSRLLDRCSEMSLAAATSQKHRGDDRHDEPPREGLFEDFTRHLRLREQEQAAEP